MSEKLKHNLSILKAYLRGFRRGRIVPSRSPDLVSHDKLWTYLGSIANDPDVTLLEIGSRAVVSDSLWKKVAPKANYIGFDYLAGKNVDIVGDAHLLSRYIPDESVDVVISNSVFEHLAAPWLVAEEISKVLKVGGHAIVETHFCFSEHELPWNFFNFHYEGLKFLFNERLGFECLDYGFSNPLAAWFSLDASPNLRGRRVGGVFCHSSILARKTRTVLTSSSGPFDWKEGVEQLTGTSSYPKNTFLSGDGSSSAE